MVILNMHISESKQTWITEAKTYGDGAVNSIFIYWNAQGSQNCTLFQQKKVTNLAIGNYW